ncbi:hypothetical protein L1049_018617 [Liquidambar formosana]|uniref:Fibronectin type-III domain-containing protein n=1 Tax=Liquidambar formosana TaxID=63359 RepID=A0AAP0WNC0_LIQFO
MLFLVMINVNALHDVLNAVVFLTSSFCVRSPSSSVQNNQEKNGQSDDVSRDQELPQECLKYVQKKELVQTCFDKENKPSALLKCKVTEQFLKMSSKGSGNQEPRKTSSQTTSNQPSRKQPRKGENPVRLPLAAGMSQEIGFSNTMICKNSACRAVLSSDDTFCKRCSCCICHLFDDNKDPSLWLVCTSEFEEQNSCGLSCHIECAIRRQKVGVFNLGQLMQLDGSYCCAACGRVSGILGCWKKQLIIAKDARRVDALCHRISLSYRLLDGTSRFKELHEIVSDAKAKLETEVGPVSGDSSKMARGIVSRLSVAADVQNLCTLGIEKADAWLNSISNANLNHREDSLPAACRLLFEEVTSSSLVIVLNELGSLSCDTIKGYKLWCCKSKSGEKSFLKEHTCVFPKTQRRILISNLQPCTEYLFRIISFTDTGNLGHSEAKCSTKSLEIIDKNSDSEVTIDNKNENSQTEGSPSNSERDPKSELAIHSSSFKVRDLGKIMSLNSAEEQGCFDGFCSADVEKCCGGSSSMKHGSKGEENPSFVSHDLDLNVASVPDLNAELTPPLDSSRDEDDGCTLEQVVEAEDDAISHGLEKTLRSRSSRSSDSQTCKRPSREVLAIESCTELCKKQTQSTKSETHDCISTLINGSTLRISGGSGSLGWKL